MKYLPLPECDDIAIIESLEKSKKLKSSLQLSVEVNKIKGAYFKYEKVKGRAHRLNKPIGLDAILRKSMESKYPRGDQVKYFIDRIKREGSPDVCPLCGGYCPSQVDHFIPRKEYPEFSFFSRNLVPACSCNQLKSTVFKGSNDERFLHPYYDEVLKCRIAYIAFSGDVATPLLEIQIIQDHVKNPNVKFHIDKLIKKTNILNWADGEWTKLTQRPSCSLLQDLSTIKKAIDVKDALIKALCHSDNYYGTPNNWQSMFLYGLSLKVDFHKYILKCVEDSSRAKI